MSSEQNKNLLRANLKINGKSILIDGIKKMNGLKKGKGLMFASKENANALLFTFDKEVMRSITSVFCPPFMAIWLNNENKIIEYKVVSPGKFSIKPSKPFTKLIEVPLNPKYSQVVDFILENGKV